MRQRIRPLLVLSAFFALASRVVPTAEEGAELHARAPGANAASAGGHFGMLSSLVPFARRYEAAGEVEPRWPAPDGTLPPFASGAGAASLAYRDLAVDGDTTISATFTVTNTGARDVEAVPQLYLVHAPDGDRVRWLGAARVTLHPGESRLVSIVADPRMFPRFDATRQQWRIDAGRYGVTLSREAGEPAETRTVALPERRFGR